MNKKLTRRILAIIALVFMVIASVTLVVTFVDPDLFHGAFGYIALITFLLGVGFFMIVKFILKEETSEPEYLPKPDDNGEKERESGGQTAEEIEEKSEPEQTESGTDEQAEEKE